MGEACSCSSCLRKAGLQYVSYPFDWLYGACFAKRVDILTTEFKDFINLEDLTDCQRNNSDRHNLCSVFKNEKNGIVFNHDFPFEQNIKDTYPDVRKKYDRRAARLISNIQDAKKVLIVYIETPAADHLTTTDDEFAYINQKLTKKFPNQKIDILYFSHSLEKTKEESPATNIRKIFVNYKSRKAETTDFLVNGKVLLKYLKDYRLNLPLWVRMKRILLTKLINIIPLKTVRRELKKKYHIR